MDYNSIYILETGIRIDREKKHPKKNGYIDYFILYVYWKVNKLYFGIDRDPKKTNRQIDI